ncbi:potassium voltage-gated channel subfamily D member 1-like [Bolinopsis microptera]|uniref:potassium voltage-gated channel subfamily D member 1-like n=1 Tax=Bolinopsis microptera TaxID=2820187 RepID=UPI0030798F96
MAMQAASGSATSHDIEHCIVSRSQSTHLNPNLTGTTRKPTPDTRRKIPLSSLTALPLVSSVQAHAVPKKKSRVWRPSLLERSQYFKANSPSILEIQEDNLSCPNSPAPTVLSEKSALLSVTEEDNHYKIFNVSGTLFVIDTTIFQDYPDTLLGSERLEKFYNKTRGEYFVEHYKHMFPVITRFYTHQEELVCPHCMTKQMFESCLEFYGLLPYYLGLKSNLKEMRGELEADGLKEAIYYTVINPDFSRIALVYTIVDVLVIVCSTVVLILETVKEVADNHYFTRGAYIVEAGVNILFTIQAILLLVVYPSIKLYFTSLMNWIDIFSVLPFYIRLMAGSYFSKAGSAFRVLRLVRLFRVMKLFRRSLGGQVLISFLYSSIPEILLLLLMWGIAILLFGPMMFFIEHEHGNDSFDSAFSGMWFCVATIGTVGYGDLYPKTDLGKFLAAVYTITNLTVMTIPVSIIITKYSRAMRMSNHRR